MFFKNLTSRILAFFDKTNLFFSILTVIVIIQIFQAQVSENLLYGILLENSQVPEFWSAENLQAMLRQLLAIGSVFYGYGYSKNYLFLSAK